MSIEIDYLRKKATYFRRWQFFGLILIAFGAPLMFIANLLVPIPLVQELNYLVWSLVVGSAMVFLGVVVAVYYSWKLSLFIIQWSKVMEEMEKRIKEIGD